MIPDAATIARRRHTVTIIVRCAISALAAWCLWSLTIGVGQLLQQLYDSGGPGSVGMIIYLALQVLPSGLLIAAMVLLHGRLVRWIVPMPRPDSSCPTCGYSLKGLKSPICPECGTSLRPAAPSR